MGIKNLYRILERYASDGMYRIGLEDLAGYVIAVDMSIYLYKFVKSSGSAAWIDSFVLLLCKFKKYGIKVECIFDGSAQPEEKKEEQLRRRESAAKKKDSIDKAKILLKNAKSEMELLVFPGKLKKLSEELSLRIKEFLNGVKKHNIQNTRDIFSVTDGLEELIERWSKQNEPIIEKYTQIAISIIESMGMRYYKAPGEAEKLCCALCCNGVVDAVLSEDTDVLAYGAPVLLSKIDYRKDEITFVHFTKILDQLDWSYDRFRDLCILLGCDYNKRKKGEKMMAYLPDKKNPQVIGTKGAFELMDIYSSLEEAEYSFTEGFEFLKHEKCRELFTADDDECKEIIRECKEKPIRSKPIVVKNLQSALDGAGCKISASYIARVWQPTQIIIKGLDEIRAE